MHATHRILLSMNAEDYSLLCEALRSHFYPSEEVYFEAGFFNIASSDFDEGRCGDTMERAGATVVAVTSKRLIRAAMGMPGFVIARRAAVDSAVWSAVDRLRFENDVVVQMSRLRVILKNGKSINFKATSSDAREIEQLHEHMKGVLETLHEHSVRSPSAQEIIASLEEMHAQRLLADREFEDLVRRVRIRERQR